MCHLEKETTSFDDKYKWALEKVTRENSMQSNWQGVALASSTACSRSQRSQIQSQIECKQPAIYSTLSKYNCFWQVMGQAPLVNVQTWIPRAASDDRRRLRRRGVSWMGAARVVAGDVTRAPAQTRHRHDGACTSCISSLMGTILSLLITL